MTRYFYTDPLAAAWMTKHFGMKVHADVWQADEYCESRRPVPLWVWARKIEQFAKEECRERFYVSPDSLPLLTPRVGDMVTNTVHGNRGRECSGLIEGLLNDGRSAVITTSERHNGRRQFVECVGQLTIVQRDAQPFFWPEREP